MKAAANSAAFYYSLRVTTNNAPRSGFVVFVSWAHNGVFLPISAMSPYFAPANENRLLQLADFVAHATYLLYERQNPILAKHIVRRFDQKDGTLHGLVHISESKGVACDCPACVSRRAPGDFGPFAI